MRWSQADLKRRRKNRIQEVRDLVYRCEGFKSVEITTSDHNRGLADSIVAGVTAVVKEEGCVIVLEDDIVTSRFFLTYMNEGLAKYQNNDRVISLHNLEREFNFRPPDLEEFGMSQF